VPALATNAAAFECLSLRLIDARRLARIAALVAGAYALIVLAVVLGLSQAPVNDFEVVVGTPAWGFAVVALGAGLFVWLGAFARTGSDPAGRPV
jgi:hypothetical protein